MGLARARGFEPHPYLTVGKRVRVRSGPFFGMEGILIRRKEKFRVVLSIHLIQRSVAVEVDEGDIHRRSLAFGYIARTVSSLAQLIRLAVTSANRGAM